MPALDKSLKEVREEAGVTRAALARHLDCSSQAIFDIEQRDPAHVRVSTRTRYLSAIEECRAGQAAARAKSVTVAAETLRALGHSLIEQAGALAGAGVHG
jgi:DNA-binding XRE family transcriptional regulator